MSNFLADELVYKQAVGLLTGLKYDLSSLFAQHKSRVDAHEMAKPTELDLKYSLTTPESWLPHFERHRGEIEEKIFIGLSKITGKPIIATKMVEDNEDCPLLSPSTIRVGAQFRLTHGQRKVLRDDEGLMPTYTVTITDIELFPGTRAIKRLVIRSNIHDKQRSMLVQASITSFGDFMQRAHDFEATAKTVSDNEQRGEHSKPIKPTKTLTIADYVL